MYILLAFTLIFLIWLIYHVIKYRNPYKLIMVFGKKGSGKTTLITKLTLQYLKKGRPVYSSVPVPGAYLFDPSRLGLDQIEPEAVIFVDEVGMIWDNRQFKEFQNHTRDYFKLQRHYHHTVYLFSQSFDVDKKLRDLTDQMFLVKNFCNCFSLARRINRRITIVHPSENSEGTSRIADDIEFDSLFWFWCGSVKLTYIPRYAKYFDSFDVPKLRDVNYKLCPMPSFPSLPDRFKLFSSNLINTCSLKLRSKLLRSRKTED